MDPTALLDRIVYLTANATDSATATRSTELTTSMLSTYEAMGNKVVIVAQAVYDGAFINDTIEQEKTRIDDLSVDARKNIYKVRQMTLLEAYNAKYYRFVTNVMILTCFVTMLCLTVGALMRLNKIKSPVLGYSIIGGILVLYSLIMMYAFSSVTSRTNMDWDQYYFKPSKDILKATSDAIASSVNTNLS